jgi:hypothetical protein
MVQGPIQETGGGGGGGGGGGIPGNTVVTETAFGQASTPGVETDYSRKDHTHGTPAAPAAGGAVIWTSAYAAPPAAAAGDAWLPTDSFYILRFA